jgi:DNA transformation protein
MLRSPPQSAPRPALPAAPRAGSSRPAEPARLESPLVAHCLELFAPLGRASARRMFGGWGLRIDELFVAIVVGERLYLKADAASAPHFAAAGCAPFVYTGGGRQVTMSFWSTPEQALDATEPMRPWALLAIDAALRARHSARPARRGPMRK